MFIFEARNILQSLPSKPNPLRDLELALILQIEGMRQLDETRISEEVRKNLKLALAALAMAAGIYGRREFKGFWKKYDEKRENDHKNKHNTTSIKTVTPRANWQKVQKREAKTAAEYVKDAESQNEQALRLLDDEGRNQSLPYTMILAAQHKIQWFEKGGSKLYDLELALVMEIEGVDLMPEDENPQVFYHLGMALLNLVEAARTFKHSPSNINQLVIKLIENMVQLVKGQQPASAKNAAKIADQVLIEIIRNEVAEGAQPKL
ncbi:unnamed protein product [Nippostrongylus brasiliensis]|uniref:Replicative DNA helicase n=1 Tax=Nippostrongylus brasiliensis TaxID=27835 RepID=A0A0N4YJ76_NIPBR|nr:unnamed protein product [Nippostrongylus brasiliensis]